MSEQAFLSGAPVKERTSSKLEIFVLMAEGDVLYCKAVNMAMAADIFWLHLGFDLSELQCDYVISNVNEVPFGNYLINES